ncbi:ABC transporter substrate-binding protein [Salininema proteolyticum]|uniref:ABC transporter substrate-binding protein n=1 Tax=Salininema proteolyticum TaxID=1607685 RepID=A0ABV8TTW8_9ACTN
MKPITSLGKASAVAAAGALLLTGCTGGVPETTDGGPIDTSGDLSGTVKFQTWSLKNEKFTPYFEDVIAAFEKEHPDVTVEWIDQPGEGYQDKILSQASSGTLPDVLNLPPDVAFPLVQADQLLDLSEAKPELEEQYNAGGWEAYSQFTGSDGTYGLPWYLGSDVSWWNLDELESYGVSQDDLPTTVDGWLDLGEKVAAESDGDTMLVSAMPTMDVLLANGIELMDEDGTFVFDTPEAADLVQGYADAYAAGAMPAEALTGSYAGNAEMYLQGKVSYTTGGPGFAGDLETKAPSLLEKTVATPRPGTPPLFVQGLNVANTSENKPAALAFAEFVTNQENQVEFTTLAAGFAPGTAEGADEVAETVAKDMEPAQAEALNVMFDALDGARAMPFQWTDAMTDYATQQLALAVRGDISAAEALELTAEYSNENRIDE